MDFPVDRLFLAPLLLYLRGVHFTSWFQEKTVIKKAYHMPSPTEIRTRCAHIRAGWTSSEATVRSKPQMLSIWLPRKRRWATITNDMVMIDLVPPAPHHS